MPTTRSHESLIKSSRRVLVLDFNLKISVLRQISVYRRDAFSLECAAKDKKSAAKVGIVDIRNPA